MDATTMPSTLTLIQRLRIDYPDFTFAVGDEYLWSPVSQTVHYVDNHAGYAFLLHELSHGLLHHAEYHHDVELIAMERAAWDQAAAIAPQYGLTIDDNTVESTLDSYRDWLHARSTCPHCHATGLQTKKAIYTCPACRHTWRVNEARMCALRRTIIVSN
jgi:ribosomal protein L37AE/L43A